MTENTLGTPSKSNAPVRILIVDDTTSIRSMLSALLSGQGYNIVAELEEGNGVMAAVRQYKPDIVCLDYQLPGRDGLDILREINETTPQIDVVFMTASEDADIEGKAADAGAAGFIRKPFSQTHILAELNQVCETRRQSASAKTEETPGLAAPQVQHAYNRRNVVIADDNGSIRLLLKGLLVSCGLTVQQSVGNGKEAVRAAQTHQPGILCLDIDMPIMDGFEALPLIKQVSPKTAVVLVTGNASREFVQKGIALGAAGYFIKPIRPANIEGFVKKFLGQ